MMPKSAGCTAAGVPKGRKAEDGTLAGHYRLKETPSASYPQRTQWNVRDSDGTVIFTMARNLTGGSKLTADAAKKLGKPWLHLFSTYYAPAEKLLGFISENNIELLNIAGTRGSKEPAVAKFVKRVLEETFFPRPQGWIGGPGEG
jgi:Circularly permutated YpsA SLOG family